MTGGPQLMTQLGPSCSGCTSIPKALEEARQAEMPGRNTTNPVFPTCTTGFVAQVASYDSSTLEFTELLRAAHSFTNVLFHSLHA